MAEEMERAEFEYTYTYDQFTVFFYGDRVFIGKKDYPVGQCYVDILNLDEALFDGIEQRVKEFVPAARNLLIEKADSAAALAQERLNAVWELIFALPVYRDLKMDEPCNYHTFQWLMADKYLEPLKRRNSLTYAEAYSCFYAQMLSAGIQVFGDDFEQGIPVEMSFVPMMHPTEEGEIFIAEKATFNSLTDFLQTEFYRGLAQGNAPRRCHNCGRYFLLTSGYNTCYCNNIAPGETARTCRKVGAHRKESQGKANYTPARKEYGRAYNRLKARKQRGKNSEDAWNAAVAKAQELVARSERGELTDEDLKRLLARL